MGKPGGGGTEPITEITFYASFPAEESAPDMIILYDKNNTLGALSSCRYYGLKASDAITDANGMLSIVLTSLTNGVATLSWSYAVGGMSSLFSASNYEVAPIYFSE